MRLRTGFEKRRARVEIVPLIDVVFLLLVFFIYAMLSMTVQRGIPVSLPGASTSEVDTRDYVVVVIDQNGELYVNDRRVSPNEMLQAVLRSRGKRGVPVYVRGDRRAPLGKVVFVIDRLREGGVREVLLETGERE